MSFVIGFIIGILIGGTGGVFSLAFIQGGASIDKARESRENSETEN